jgi:hypothetical protein
MKSGICCSGLAFAVLLFAGLAGYAQTVTAPAAKMPAPMTPAIRSTRVKPTTFGASFGATSFAVLSWSYGTASLTGPAPGVAGHAETQSVDIVRYVDATSAVLAQQMVGGKAAAPATLTITGYNGTQAVMKMIFANAWLVSRSMSGAVGTARPEESLRFNYTQSSVTYIP